MDSLVPLLSEAVDDHLVDLFGHHVPVEDPGPVEEEDAAPPLLHPDGIVNIITSGAFEGQRGFFTHDESGAVVGVDFGGLRVKSDIWSRPGRDLKHCGRVLGRAHERDGYPVNWPQNPEGSHLRDHRV
jgi:hypothetical protein